MFKTIALVASLVVPAFAIADEGSAPAQTTTAQPSAAPAGSSSTAKTSKVSKVRKSTKKASQGRVGSKVSRASSAAPAPSTSASGSVAK